MAKHPDITVKAPSGEKLTPKQRAFVHAYIDPDSETFGNGTRSAMVAGYRSEGREVASVTGSRTLASANVKTYMGDLFAQAGMGEEVRASILAKIANGEETIEKESETTYRDGSKVKTVAKEKVSPRDRLRAIELMYKAEGTFDRNRAAADAMSTALKRDMTRWRRIVGADFGADTDSGPVDSDTADT